MKPFNVAEIMRSLDNETTKIMQETGKRVVAAVVLSTPIGRPDLWLRPAPAGYRPGTARGNWRVTITNPPPAEELPIQDPAGSTTIQLGEATIRFWNGKDVLYIGNAADHIVPLDQGIASRQVGANFIEKAVATAVASMADSRKDLP